MEESLNQNESTHELRPRALVPYALISVLCIVFFCVIGPGTNPSFRMVAGFIALAGLLFGVTSLFLRLTGLYERVSERYRRGILTAVIVLPVVLLMLQSTGQLTVRDGLVLGGLFSIGIFYVGRIRISKKP